MSTHAEAWYYSTTGETSGPVSEVSLRQLFDAGALGWHHSVRHRSWDRWYTVREAAASLGWSSVSLNPSELDPTIALPRPVLPAERVEPGDSSPAPPISVPAPFSSNIGKVVGRAGASVGPLPTPIVPPQPDPILIPPKAVGLPLVTRPAEAESGAPVPSRPHPVSVGGVTAIHRIVSWIIDIVAFVVVLLVLDAVLPTDIAMLFTFVVYVVYLVVGPVRGYDTLGHLVVGLRVTRRVDDGASQWLVYGTRAAVVLLLAAPCLVGLIASACSMFSHPEAVAWQDVATGTTMVKVKAFEFTRKAALVTVLTSGSDVAP